MNARQLATTSTIRRRVLLGGGLLLLLGALGTLLLWPARQRPEPALRSSFSSPELERRWGIEQLRVSRTAAGQLLDFRYRVVDEQKAAPLQKLEAKVRPFLVDLKSGKRLGVPSTPKAGPLWNHAGASAGRHYFALFANPGRLVRKGDRVSVVIDKFVADNLVVE